MLSAAHGAWCGTRTWPTHCPSCSAAVFFFMCNCGSKIFFDDLGPPWPIHSCDTSWARKLKRTTDISGRTTVQLAEGISVTRSTREFSLDTLTLESWRRKHSKDFIAPIVAIVPTHGECRHVVGVLREIERSADPFKKFGISAGSIGAAFLGPLAGQAVGKVTIHSQNDPDFPSESFTFWVPTEIISDSRIVKGISVAATIDCVEIGKLRVWYCDEFDVLG